jgi:hypothetical protein
VASLCQEAAIITAALRLCIDMAISAF